MGTSRTGRPGLFLYEGKTLDERLSSVVERVVERFDPLKVILFGSLARGEANYDSDVDLLVVFEHAELENKRALAVDISRAIVPSFAFWSPRTPQRRPTLFQGCGGLRGVGALVALYRVRQIGEEQA